MMLYLKMYADLSTTDTTALKNDHFNGAQRTEALLPVRTFEFLLQLDSDFRTAQTASRIDEPTQILRGRGRTNTPFNNTRCHLKRLLHLTHGLPG